MKSIFILMLSVILFNNIKANAQTEVTFYTNQGDFVVTLYDFTMPITTNNFKSLVSAKFYDSIIFHRVIKNFMIQGGDPNGDGSGGPGYTIQDEFVTGISNIQKTISMANAGPNTGGSQFFINLVNNTYLDFDKAPLTSAHPVFGITTSNFSVVQTIGNVPTNISNDKPISDVVMDSVRITKAIPAAVKDLSTSIGSIDIYPNPIQENSEISIMVPESKLLQISLMDQQGRIIFQENKNFLLGKNNFYLRTLLKSPLANGNYFFAISDGFHFVHKKLVVQE